MRGVDPKDKFAGAFDKLSSSFVPLLPLNGIRDLPFERLSVVLLVAFIFSELFVKPISNAMPPLPLREIGLRLLARNAIDSRISSNSISRLISFPDGQFFQSLKYAVL